MKGRVCLVTGATSGIGLYTALGLAQRGATVLMAGRDGVKGGEAKAWVEQKAGAGAGRVALLLADFSSLVSTRALAERVASEHGALHVLVNNAGAIFQHRTLTKDGFERTFGVNHLAPFLLTELLRPALERGAPSRIVNVASAAHRRARLDLDDPDLEKGWSAWRSYSNSKLMNVMHAYALSRRLAGRGVSANALHPGVINSGFAKNDGGLSKLIWSLMSPFLTSSEQGARTQIFLASAPEVEGVSGKYFIDQQQARSTRTSHDEALQERLWSISAERVGLVS